MGATAAVLAAVGGWLLWPEDLPTQWPDKASFCANASAFEVTRQDQISGEQRLAAARAMEKASPQALRDEMHVLVDDLVPESEPHSHVSAEEFQEITVKVGEFVERACGVNLPSIRT
ncbi:hypothetical protein [Catellatospora vulcania]|uniref:hypothetical protein n=1 Tax=Catellatospora vulcania TaxID=1460450 RepID=UPI0012D4BC9A|nr:hypothetical protein [Catellatospora vulcania]